MINAIRRVVRRVRKVCLSCGEVPVKGTPHCWDCSLTIIADYDETLAELVTVLTEKPAYHEEEHWCESCQTEHGFRCPNNRLH